MSNNEKRLSIPYNYDFKGTLELIKKYNRYISEVYFPINPNIIGSGRGGREHEYYDEMIKALIANAKSYNVKTNMIINPIGASEVFADSKNYDRILNYIDFFCNVHDVDYVTITNPILAKSIRDVTKSSRVVASVNMFINSFEGIKKAVQLGFAEFYLDRESNWDIDLIKSVKENFKNIKLRIMLNEGCIPNCLFRISHFDALGLIKSKESLEEIKHYEEKHRIMGCQATYLNDPSSILKTPVLRPEDLKYYSQYVDTFKVVGRTTPTNINEIRIKAYGEGRYDGDFLLLIDNSVAKKTADLKNFIIPNQNFPEDYIERKFKCTKICSSCGYCSSVINRVMKKK